jgi:hypothetical protein
MEKWLNCTISQGQFSGEFAVQGVLFDDTSFSLFAEEQDLRFDNEPQNNESVQGLVRVTTLDSRDDLFLVELPQPTIGNGRAITVKADKITQ